MEQEDPIAWTFYSINLNEECLAVVMQRATRCGNRSTSWTWRLSIQSWRSATPPLQMAANKGSKEIVGLLLNYWKVQAILDKSIGEVL